MADGMTHEGLRELVARKAMEATDWAAFDAEFAEIEAQYGKSFCAECGGPLAIGFQNIKGDVAEAKDSNLTPQKFAIMQAIRMLFVKLLEQQLIARELGGY